ncbi:MAG TPA: hypothetical protein VGR63_17360 [Casimicrobiaceae bacterium]|jgi:hypothetical protein|nr:hypothetical protein [Casimicrobiaceae bacterium]
MTDPWHDRPHRVHAVLVVAALLLAACASTTLKDSWADPSYARGTFKKWIVVGVGGGTVSERTFEDVMVSKLRARGVDALPGYRFLPEGRASEAQLDGAVTASGADALMMVHLRRVQTRTQVTTAMVPGPAYGGFGWYGVYGGWYAVPEVRQYDIATVETTVYEVYGKKLVWSGVTETFDPRSVAQEAPQFCDVVLGALAARAMVPADKG